MSWVIVVPFLGNPVNAVAAEPAKARRDSVRIGLCENVAPSQNEAGEPDGILVDLWRAWGRRNTVNVEFHIFAGHTSAKRALADAEIDLIGGIETQQVDSSLLLSGAIACFNRVAVHRKRVQRRDFLGVQDRTIEIDVRLTEDLPHLEKWLPKDRTKVRTTRSNDQDAIWVTSEVFKADVHALSFESQCEKSFVLYKRLVFFCTRPDQAEFMDFVESGWDRIDKSELLSIESTWLPAGRKRLFDKNTRLAFTPDEISILARHPVLLLGASRWEPLTIVDENQNYSGIALDLATLHFELLGMTPVFDGSEWESVKARFDAGKLDGLGYAVPDPKRRDERNISDPYVYAPLVVVTREGEELTDQPEDLRGKSFGIIDDYGFGQIFEIGRPDISIRQFSDRRDAAEALRDGTIDGWLEIAPTARKIAADLGIDNFRIAFRTNLVDGMSLILQKDLAVPCELFNRALRCTNSEQVGTIYSRYEPLFQENNSAETTWLLFGLSLLVILSFAFAARQSLAARRSRKAVERSEQTLRLAQRLSRSGTLEFDPSTQKVRMIGETYRVFGIAPPGVEETAAEHSARFDADSARKFVKACQECCPHNKAPQSIECMLNSETVLQYDFTWADQATNATCLISIHDVTDRIRRDRERTDLNEKVSQLKKLEALGRLAGGIAHDFNNILSASIVNNELAIESIRKDHPAHGHMRDVLNSSLRAKDLVAQILSFSSGRGVVEETVDLNHVAEESVIAVRSSTPDNVVIEITASPTPVLVTANSTKLMQVFINLLSNAAQAMPHGGHVRVHIARKGRVALVQVGDEGAGIPEEIKARVFDPFFTTRKVGEGTGMGLAIVHTIVRSLSGEIYFESSSEGTVFCIELPAVEADSDTEATDNELSCNEDADTPEKGKGVRIIAVDDEEMVLDAAVRVLTLLGYDVRGFTCADEALSYFCDQPEDFDLLITDMSMPDVSGMELLESVREVRRDFPAIVCSGYDLENEFAAYPHLRQSVTRLNKPFTSKTLASAIQRGLSAKETS